MAPPHGPLSGGTTVRADQLIHHADPALVAPYEPPTVVGGTTLLSVKTLTFVLLVTRFTVAHQHPGRTPCCSGRSSRPARSIWLSWEARSS